MRPLLFLLLLSVGMRPHPVFAESTDVRPAPGSHPNVVVLLADDMGYGDPGCYNPNSKCRTPSIDKLAEQGMRFTDAHAAGTTCIPSRYGLITGCYPFRSHAMNPNKGPLIAEHQVTVASLLRSRGYATAMVGKWHLGFTGGSAFDCSQPLRGGPTDSGFDQFFGQHASLDIPPYFYIENDQCLAAPSERIEANASPDWSPIQGAFWRAGGVAPGFKLDEVLPTYTHKAVEYIEGRSRSPQPFFLYVALTAPHTPWLPTEKFRSESAGHLYTDWIAQVDDSIGQILDALDRAGITDETLVIFSSDNGPVWYPEDVVKYGHASTGPFRGMKADAWEGGHREPFIVRWPQRVQAGSTSTALVCFTDLLATFAEMTHAPLPADAGEDSFSFLATLTGHAPSQPVREELVLGVGKGNLSIRQGDWKYIPFLGSGGFTKPSRIKPGPGEAPGQLYHLAQDPGETTNLSDAHPDRVASLTERIETLQKRGRSRP